MGKRRNICLAAGIVMLTASVFAFSVPAEAEGGMNTERAMAGMSVAWNHYYASNDESNSVSEMIYEVTSAREAAAEEEETEEDDPEVTEEEPETEETEEEEEPEETEEVSPYANIAIAQVNNEDGYVNIRTEPNTQAEIVGKIYHNCAATILDVVDGEGGDWYQVQSGSVEGYMKSEFFITGSDAEQIAKEIGTVYATVISPTLKVREEPDLGEDVHILTLLPLDGKYIVTEENDEWAYLQVDADTSGWVYKDCVSISVKFNEAISLEEEAAAAEEAERLQREYEAAQEAYENSLVNNTTQTQTQNTAAEKETTQAAAPQKQTPAETQTAAETTAPQTQAASDSSGSALRSALCAYAQQFIGNPYVYGGASLTNGADCSGFVMAVFAQYGYSLPHSSAAQANCGTRISLNSVQPGDLVFYSNNGSSIGHVGIYIGNGQIIHAVSESCGIQVWSMYYKTPCAATRILP